MRYGILKNDKIKLVEEGEGLPVIETAFSGPLEYGTKAVAHYEQQGEQIVKVWELVPWSEQDWENAHKAEAEPENGSICLKST